MNKIHFYMPIFLFLGLLSACTHRPSKVELMRIEKAQKDSLQYMQAQQNLRYSDSLLQVYLPQVDPLMQSFVYSRNEKAEDHGHYVHRRLQTTSNTSRNFMQAYVADDHATSLQSYYFGSRQMHQKAIRVQVGEDYIVKEGSNHAFNAGGWHEIMTIEGQDAIQLLSFISSHIGDPIQVQILGDQKAAYCLSKTEKEALAQTYQLSMLMSNIDALERAIHVADLQIQKYEKKHANCK